MPKAKPIATMQQPSTLRVRHAEAGAPIEAVVRVAGKLEVVPISDRHALELISDLSAALARNTIEADRREQTSGRMTGRLS